VDLQAVQTVKRVALSLRQSSAADWACLLPFCWEGGKSCQVRGFAAVCRLALALLLIDAARPVVAQGTAAAKGERIYENYCANCHGEQLQNNSNGLSFDLRRLKPNERLRFVEAVKNGKNKMPPWKDVLGELEIEQLWSYIQTNISR
jgi:mono/diheme cytochrome c family protein